MDVSQHTSGALVVLDFDSEYWHHIKGVNFAHNVLTPHWCFSKQINLNKIHQCSGQNMCKIQAANLAFKCNKCILHCNQFGNEFGSIKKNQACMPLSSVGIGGDSFEVKEDKNVSCLFPSLLAKRVARLSHPMRPARRRRRHWPKCLKYRRGSPVIFTTYLRQCTSAHAADRIPLKRPTCNFDIIRLERNRHIWHI